MKICRTCGICCTHTEMILSLEEIENISKNLPDSHKNEKFYEYDGQYYRLINVNGNCVFFLPEEKKCLIYSFRPMGCRFYPMIFDLDSNSCILDNECPYNRLFYSNPTRFKKVCFDLKRWLSTNILKRKK